MGGGGREVNGETDSLHTSVIIIFSPVISSPITMQRPEKNI